jgi:hypothetical protein
MRLVNSQIVVNLRMDKKYVLKPRVDPKTGKAVITEGWVETFVAIGPNNPGNGFCRFGAKGGEQECTLQSGDAVHVMANEQKEFPGTGPSYTLVLLWTVAGNVTTAARAIS